MLYGSGLLLAVPQNTRGSYWNIETRDKLYKKVNISSILIYVTSAPIDDSLQIFAIIYDDALEQILLNVKREWDQQVQIPCPLWRDLGSSGASFKEAFKSPSTIAVKECTRWSGPGLSGQSFCLGSIAGSKLYICSN